MESGGMTGGLIKGVSALTLRRAVQLMLDCHAGTV